MHVAKYVQFIWHLFLAKKLVRSTHTSLETIIINSGLKGFKKCKWGDKNKPSYRFNICKIKCIVVWLFTLLLKQYMNQK